MPRHPPPSLASDGAQALAEKIERPGDERFIPLRVVFKVQQHVEQCEGDALDAVRCVHGCVPSVPTPTPLRPGDLQRIDTVDRAERSRPSVINGTLPKQSICVLFNRLTYAFCNVCISNRLRFRSEPYGSVPSLNRSSLRANVALPELPGVATPSKGAEMRRVSSLTRPLGFGWAGIFLRGATMTVFWFLVAWVCLGILAGNFVGAFIKFGMGSDQ